MILGPLFMKPTSQPSNYPHVPVLLSEITAAFNFGRPALVVDGTLGLGGHTEALLERYPEMRVIGFDWDASALTMAGARLARFGKRFEGIRRSYASLPEYLKEQAVGEIDGLLLDLGLSSKQLSDEGRGFSFSKAGPLDMRMSLDTRETAWDLINRLDEGSLIGLLREFGEEPHARRIAEALKAGLQDGTLTNDAGLVAERIRQAVPGWHGRLDKATRSFQGLRIAVNHELENVDTILQSLRGLLKSGGRAAIISFHSLEDRRVKRAFQDAANDCVCPPDLPVCCCDHRAWAALTPRKAIQPTEQEVAENPRSRSARLRIMEKR
jgi:16S rRNA (cytosine1402-N4)-methyltransferase